jgi:catechol 2,3-dioxygenase-like lactoylglutathione lyase family enzyme
MTVLNHTGLVVSDLDRSKRFYQEAFGFAFWFEFMPPDEPTAKLISLEPPLEVTACYLTLGDFVLELMHYAAPGASAPFRTRTMNEPGLTHLSISVDDVRATAARVAELGGSIIEESEVGIALMVRDPDGQLIELLPVSYRTNLPPKP